MATPDEIKKLQEYYEVNLNHARWSFWAALGSVIVGLIVLLFGVYMLYSRSTIDAGVTATVAGVLSEFISTIPDIPSSSAFAGYEGSGFRKLFGTIS